MQGDSWVVDFGGGEGEMRGGIAERGGGGEGGGIGDGLLEELLGFGGTVEADEGLGAVVKEGGVGVVGLGGDEGGVEWVGLVGMTGFDVNAGEQAGDAGVGRILRVEGFDEGNGLRGFGVIAGVEICFGELRGEAGIAGGLR